ncbi:hypothetical protein C3747_613g39c [Trypanosoma cruzi]|uniref:Uncharacterized protein n=2 Tax=Trypanosoma cruzi TaxID=5693 RepID=Q4DVN2_TRYCC|nr:hypothetical protein, conserved [Trypanosoma cruzi]EAN96582.1 hypothetical protein, conserved [Trypanosoma cruzi]PWU85538.1 hypothetical protein C3747_613g39c [Trypanosoma cruzi]|eukprot:XP_818433.1 hypothetical protein [Trypanosoma cruzi strain CL Brener]
MPGRHGKQRVKRKKSKRQKPSEMERVLLDSIHGRKRRERDILKKHLPPPVKLRSTKVALNTTLPMFNPLPPTTVGAAAESRAKNNKGKKPPKSRKA